MATEGLVERVLRAVSELVVPPEKLHSEFEYMRGTLNVTYVRRDATGTEVSRQTSVLMKVNGQYVIKNPDFFGPDFIPVDPPQNVQDCYERDQQRVRSQLS